MKLKTLICAITLLLSGQTFAQISAKSYIVLDEGGQILFERNAQEVRSIASITKLISLSHVSPNSKPIEITNEERDTVKHTRMRIKGVYPENELLGLALVHSNNEAAKAVGRANPLQFKEAQKRFPDIFLVEPSGLDPNNRASAEALARAGLEISKMSIAEQTVKPTTFLGGHSYKSTNPLLQAKGWNFKLSKTGYIREAGGCIVVVIEVAGKLYSVVVLGSSDTRQRWRDLALIRKLFDNESFADFSPQIKSKNKRRR